MAPRETENNAYEKFWGDKERALWHVIIFKAHYNLFHYPYNACSIPENCHCPGVNHWYIILTLHL